MSHQKLLLLTIGLTLAWLVLACDILESTVVRDTPTPDRVPTRVAEIKTSEAIETRARETLIAEAPKVTPTPTSMSTTPAISTPKVTSPPTVVLPTVTSPATRAILLKQGEWKGSGGPEITGTLLFDAWGKDCLQDPVTKIYTCPEFSIYFSVHEGNKIAVGIQSPAVGNIPATLAVKFRLNCSTKSQGAFRSVGISPASSPTITVTNNEVQFDFGWAKVFGKVVAPNRIEGTYQAKWTSSDPSDLNCENATGNWTASPQ
jgi:hypothetical protein